MKTASIVFFYFGDSPFVSLAQETVPVGMALKGYDRSVLLHFDMKVGPFQISGGDEKYATVIDLPTEKNLVEQLDDLRTSGYRVDLFLFAHGGPGTFRASLGKSHDDNLATTGWFEANVRPLKLNAVWQCNCWGSTWNSTWRKLGATVCAGTRSVNFYPSRFGPFMRSWTKGSSFGEAVAQSNSARVRTPSQAWMMAQAASRTKEWSGSLFSAATVLGKNQAAESYFKTCWLGNDWQPELSGRQNMNYASEMIVEGNAAIPRT